MAYFYAKSGGTATGDGGRYASKQTGTFAALGASGYYADINSAMGATTPPTSGDYICVSDSHSKSYSSEAVTIFSGPTSGNPIYLVSVSDTNVDQYSAKTSSYHETATGGTSGEIGFEGRWALFGMYFSTEAYLRFYSATAWLDAELTECILDASASGDNIEFWSPGSRVRLINSTISGVSGSDIRLSNNQTLEMFGGAFTGYTTGFNTSTGALGGCNVLFNGVDLSSITGYIIQDGGNNVADDEINIRLHGCKLNASLTGFWNETIEKGGQYLLATNSSATSAAAEYQYYFQAYAGAVEDETSFYRDGSTAFPSSTKISLKCVTTANSSKGRPFWFDFPTRYSALSSTSTDNITIYLLTSATLYDSDVWAEIVYPDGTNKQTYNFLTTRHAEILDTNGTELTTNTESSWTGRTTENRYRIDLDTSSDAGANCVPIIRVYVAKASTTIYFCPTLGLS